MRSIAACCVLLFGLASGAWAQAVGNVTRSGDVALAYHWVHTNAPPRGGCGCFPLNGFGISGSWNFGPSLSAVAELSLDHTGNALSTSKSLSLTSFMGGVRYRLPALTGGNHPLQPFAQILAGGAHAGGGEAGVADGTTAFASRFGGGIDMPINQGIILRLLQADYFMTDFANSADNRQNNILIGAGISLRWAR